MSDTQGNSWNTFRSSANTLHGTEGIRLNAENAGEHLGMYVQISNGLSNMPETQGYLLEVNGNVLKILTNIDIYQKYLEANDSKTPSVDTMNSFGGEGLSVSLDVKRVLCAPEYELYHKKNKTNNK